MPLPIKTAAISGALGMLIMFAIWWTGLPPKHLWMLAFWPSQVVGIGTDGVSAVSEATVQFALYAVVGALIGLALVLVRRST